MTTHERAMLSARAKGSRRACAKATALQAAIHALVASGISPVRAFVATADQAHCWHLHANTADTHPGRPLDGDRFTVSFTNLTAAVNLEQRRLTRLLSYFRTRGIEIDRVVTGTKHGPDMMLRLASGAVAVIEVRGRLTPLKVRRLLKTRYSHLQDVFQIYSACECAQSRWRFHRLLPDGKLSVCEPEVLRG